MTSPLFTGFGTDAFEFFSGLEENNTREYWEANKATWTRTVSEPLHALAEELEPEFGDAKIFRPYRDVRFSADKSPYKEQASFVVMDRGAALYFQLSTAGVMMGGGLHDPARDQLERFRDLQDDPDAVNTLDATLTDLGSHGIHLGDGAPVKTAPRGRDKNHPRIDFIRRTTLTVFRQDPPADWMLTERCLDEVVEAWHHVQEWNGWLADYVGESEEPAREYGRRSAR